MKLHSFVANVAGLHFPNTFNPYSDCCPVHDRDDAPSRRAKALSTMIGRAVEAPIDAIWIGRDLGYRGGRRTGMALTDDVHLEQHARRWNMQAERLTVGTAVAERTAAVIWSMLDQIESRVFLWNVFPLHPHEADDPFTNRQHNSLERAAGEAVLATLVSLLRPRRILAIGNDAAAAAQRVTATLPVVCVRHPSYGGQTQFLRQISELYEISSQPRSLF